MSCRYDRTAKAHLLREHRADCTERTCKGCLPCTHDDQGNPVRHCRTRLRCTSHLGWDEHTCPTCLDKIRGNLTGILDALALMPDEAVEQGVDSEPANLAGPHADYVTAQWRLVNADRAGVSVEELDMRDPYTCLTMHERTIREELDHDGTTLVSPTLAGTVAYLGWVLTDLAHDEERTWMLVALLGDTARLRSHVEAALGDSKAPERGVPCPDCTTAAEVAREEGRKGVAPERLRRIHGHWCTQEGCTRAHYLDDSGDRWVCPVDPDHEWSQERYENYIEARHEARVSERMGA